ncbi:MAG: cytochrome c3 family protein [Pseudomonadota bacterium]
MLFRLFLLTIALLSAGASAGVIEKVILPGKVITGHAKYELECERCHQHFDKSAQSGLCLDCHKDIDRDVKARTGMHGRSAEKPCKSCHTEHKGREARIAALDKRTFDHAQTEFSLNGAHKEAKCEGCHQPRRKYRQAPKLCNDCHRRDDFEKGHKGHLGAKCESCHNESDWKETRFDHEKTRFRLLGGKHADAKCKACHVDKTYQDTPLTCVGCHRKDDQAKGHKGRYGGKCESCHNDRGWKEIRFNHDADTRYPLKGKHRETRCDSCHLPQLGALYKQKWTTTCVSCHKQDDREKGHRGALGDKCESCHTERDWKTTSFDHDKTKFPLRDKHRDAKCESCHKGGVSGLKANIRVERACVACHRKQDEEKGHKGRYGNKCETCHTSKDWKASLFSHDRDTKYALRYKHRQVKCDACHLPELGDIYRHKPDAQCYACHRKDDKHKGQLGRKCESCHDEKRWQGVPYDHNRSRYPLTGSHARVPCKNCHATPAYHDVALTCHGCHEANDKHKRRYGTKCEACHYTGTWKSWDFDHRSTRFALDGAHADLACEDCHTEATIGRKLGRNCIACHDRDDVHDGGFGQQCERCHVTSDWKKYRR